MKKEVIKDPYLKEMLMYKLYNKFLNFESYYSEKFDSPFGQFRVTFDKDLGHAEPGNLGVMNGNLLGTTIIYIDAEFSQTVEEKLLVFCHEFAHFVNLSCGESFTDHNEEELSAHYTATTLSEWLDLGEIPVNEILNFRHKINNEKRCEEICQMSDYISEMIKEYFAECGGEKYTADPAITRPRIKK